MDQVLLLRCGRWRVPGRGRVHLDLGSDMESGGGQEKSLGVVGTSRERMVVFLGA